MAASQDGNMGLWSGYTAGDNGWNNQYNQNWDALDALVQCTVKNSTTTTPPGSPANGDSYIVPSGATGAWTSQTNKIAVWVSRGAGAWVFYSPKNGWSLYDQAASAIKIFNGSSWTTFSGGGGSSSLTIRSASGTTDTLVIGDASNWVEYTNASAVAVTVPTNASVAFPVGTSIYLRQAGAGQITVAGAGGVTVNSSSTLKTRAQYSVIALVQTAANVWALFGDVQ